MIEHKYIIIAGEEAGPKSNKMGGIWNVIDAEMKTLAAMLEDGTIDEESIPRIFVAGPYFDHSGVDWNKSLNRITDLKELDSYEPDEVIKNVFSKLVEEGIELVARSQKIKNIEIIFLAFKTSDYCRKTIQYKGRPTCLENKIKAEAYDLIQLDSRTYENMANGNEYTHYLNLSYAISEFVRNLVCIKEKNFQKKTNREASEFVTSVMPTRYVSLHCHEFGLFYAIARLEKLCVRVNSVATCHATIPGRAAGHRSIQKIRENDNSLDPNTPINMAELESLSSYADVVTAVGDSTRKELKLFYGIDSIVVRNGIELDAEKEEISWDKKNRCRKQIQDFLANRLHEVHDGVPLVPEKIIPIFSLSRIEIDNKGYPDLLDSLVLLDRMIRMKIESLRLDEDYRIVCFIVAAHGPKNNLPNHFPIDLPEEILIGSELRLQSMIMEKGLEAERLLGGDRHVGAVFYPQWLSSNDGGLNMTVDELMAGCIAGIFPSRYEPFLLTGLEAGKEATPSIVSKVCGFSDALKTLKRLVMGMGGVIVVDNINLPYIETLADYALTMEYFIETYTDDLLKYNLLCREASLLAHDMNWQKPVKDYYEILTGDKIE
ncbi:glycosyltransferase [Methanohalophilus halophilus]|uniref:Glycogen synthase n=1 Tax=Methanohalophilus halophilus TaxID=2177 RepID=A0A3M9L852_9EURY|nr:glycosyltransferase [Methanohalophilus halophilus]RNI09187.1 glycogen synthase [Methanohalophilus halophilus]